jgi:hypothetical protein
MPHIQDFDYVFRHAIDRMYGKGDNSPYRGRKGKQAGTRELVFSRGLGPQATVHRKRI